MKKFPLHWQILGAIVLAGLVGSVVDVDTVFLGIGLHSTFDFMGTLFLNGLKMVIVPLVFSSIICGVAGMGSGDGIGRLGGKTILFYMLSSLSAILVGLLLVNLLTPGLVGGEPALNNFEQASPAALEQQLARVEGRGVGDVVQVFVRMVPANIVQAAADGQMLGIIFFALLFGFYMMRLQSKYKETLQNFWQAVFETMMSVTMFIMKFAPLGVFGLVAKTVSETGFDLFRNLIVFFLTVVAALAIHIFVVLPLVLRFVAGVNPLLHYKAMAPAMLTAFSTASSSGTLPLTMECVEKNAGVSNRTTSFVLPLGATINMDGTALYECVAAMFIAQAYGLELTFATQFLVVFIALLTSIGVAGIPAASLVAIMIILSAVGLPPEGIGLLMITDRILDMMRTSVNVFSDSCCAVVIAKTEGEEGVLQSNAG